MASREEWDEAVALIKQCADPFSSRDLGRLFRAARDDGRRWLASFRHQFGDDVILDLIHDLLAEKLPEILAGDDPRALFRTAITRRAISWGRRGGARVAEDPTTEPAPEGDVAAEQERSAFVIDAREVLASLPQRDREVVVAVALGEDREEIARRFKTSRANVDQILRRTRVRFAERDAR